MELNYQAVMGLCEDLANRQLGMGHESVYGVPAGGVPVAIAVASRLELPVVDVPGPKTLVVDDLVDSGNTLSRFNMGGPVDALIRKPHSPAFLAPAAMTVDGWVRFPWENASAPEDAVVRLLQYIGEDPTRDGLRDTPKRVTKAWREMTAGYAMDAAEHLAVSFDVACDQMVVVPGIDFVSFCEHHMLPFRGTASVGYLPDKRVVGLSKFARVVDVFAKRLQVQERMTQQIADAIQNNVAPLGVGVVVKATHDCMTVRGVRKHHPQMITSALHGAFLHDKDVRDEFFALAAL